MIGLGVVAIVALLCLITVVDSLRLGIGPVPSSPAATAVLLDAVAATTGPIVELGCGIGSLSIKLARSFPARTVLAVEQAWVPFCVAFTLARLSGAPNLRVVRGDLHQLPIGDAGVAVCFLFRGAMARLAADLPGRMRPGAQVVSLTFALPGWTPEATSHVADLWRSPVYRYRVR